MAKLSKREQTLLDKLTQKAEAPDTSPTNRTLNVSVDLGDPAQVEQARKLGLLGDLDDDDDDGDGDGDGDGEGEGDGEETPRRRGYFKTD